MCKNHQRNMQVTLTIILLFQATYSYNLPDVTNSIMGQIKKESSINCFVIVHQDIVETGRFNIDYPSFQFELPIWEREETLRELMMKRCKALLLVLR